APMETALLTATGFRAGETVNLRVVRDDGTSYAPWAVTDGGASDLDGAADGNITTSWGLPSDSPGATFRASAAGATSQLTAEALFTGLATWVLTNRNDYAPGETATVFAGGFRAGETVQFQVANQSN